MIPPTVKIFVCTQPQDMRRSFDGLALATRQLHADFHSAEHLRRAVLAFMDHWNRDEAHPFNWTFRGRFVQNRPRLAA